MALVQLCAWIALCTIAAALFHERPASLALAALSIWTLIPGVASHIVTGAVPPILAVHPATWLVFATITVQAIHHPTPLLSEVARRCWIYLILSAVGTAALLMTRFGTAPNGHTLLIDQFIAPVLMFAILSASIADKPPTIIHIRNVVLALATCQSVLALLQWASVRVLFFEKSYLTNYWFHPETWNRWMGTTDHPLVLSLLICAAVPLVSGLSRASLQVAIIAILVLATVVTQSRTGAALVPVGIIYVVIRSRARMAAKMMFALTTAIGGYLLLTSSLTQQIAERIRDDTGSSDARAAALNFFLESWQQFMFTGDGITTSYRVARLGGLGTSLESSFLMYAVGIGIVATTLYFGVQVFIVAQGSISKPLRGATLAGLMMLIVPETFSALGVDTLVGPLLWTILVLVARHASLRRGVLFGQWSRQLTELEATVPSKLRQRDV